MREDSANRISHNCPQSQSLRVATPATLRERLGGGTPFRYCLHWGRLVVFAASCIFPDETGRVKRERERAMVGFN